MDDNALVHIKCPNCGKYHLDTLGHLTAHWQQQFQCKDGCSLPMKLDRQELLDAIEAGAVPLNITMRSVE
jgi:hypothetical protein